MEVNGITSRITGTLQTETLSQKEPPQSSEIPEPDIAESEGGDDEGTKGVIRNILNGHYKGVSDVRLRINHYEELAAIENEQLTAVAEEVTGLLAVLEDVVGEILGSSEPMTTEAVSEGESEAEPNIETVTVSGLHDEFVDTVNGITEEFQLAETPSIDNLVSGIENAFEDFIASLQDLLMPPVEEGDSQASEGEEITSTETQESAPPEPEQMIGEEPVGTESEPLVIEPLAEEPAPPALTGSDHQSLIDELGSTFAAAIAELTEALNGTGILPELSEPTGNGVAYKKFLDIYNQMRTGETVEDDTDNAEDVNIIA